MNILPIEDALQNEGLWPEFIETLVNDPSFPEKLRRQIWTLCTTEDSGLRLEEVSAMVAAAFTDSDGERDLIARWNGVVEEYWPRLHNCKLKAEIDALS